MNDWIKPHNSSNIRSTVASFTREYLFIEHQILQKAVTDLSTKIDSLTAQQPELSSQITSYTCSTNSLPGQYPIF